MNDIHGVIACAGNGTRFAESVGKPHPYPKHLEIVGEKTVLNRALDGLIGNIGIKSATVTLNPALLDQYIEHLRQIQRNYPGIELTFAPAIEVEQGLLFTNIRETLSNTVCSLQGEKIEVGDRTVAIALGDSIITEDEAGILGKDIEESMPRIREGESFALFRDIEKRGLIYWVSRMDSLGETDPDMRRGASEYGINWWNCNTYEELQEARRGLGIPNIDGEVTRYFLSKERAY